ncbi:mCG1028342, partial [Mus musculus]
EEKAPNCDASRQAPKSGPSKVPLLPPNKASLEPTRPLGGRYTVQEVCKAVLHTSCRLNTWQEEFKSPRERKLAHFNPCA